MTKLFTVPRRSFFYVVLFLAVPLLFPASALAAKQALDVYTWDINGVSGALNAIRGITGSNDYILIARFIIAVTVVATTVSYFFTKRLSLRVIITVWLVSTLTFGPKIPVVLHDIVGPPPGGIAKNVGTTRVIPDVPASIAIMAHVQSAVGYGFRRLFEQWLIPVDADKLENGGLVFGARAISRYADIDVGDSDTYLAENIERYYSDCVMMDVMLGDRNIDVVKGSENILENIAPINGLLITDLRVLIGGDWVPKSYTCFAAYTKIKDDLNAWSLASEKNIITTITGKSDIINYSLTELNSAYFGNSMTTQDTLKQMAMQSMYSKSVTRFYTEGAGGSIIAESNINQAVEAKRDSAIVAGIVSQETMNAMRGTLETMYYALFPVFLFMLLTPLAPKALSYYFMLFMSLQIWEILFTILNFKMILALKEKIVVIQKANAYGTAISLAQRHMLFNAVNNQISAACNLSVGAAALALSIAKLSEIMMSTAVSGWSAGASQVGSQYGGRIADGSSSMAAVSHGVFAAGIVNTDQVSAGNHKLAGLSANSINSIMANVGKSGMYGEGLSKVTQDRMSVADAKVSSLAHTISTDRQQGNTTSYEKTATQVKAIVDSSLAGTNASAEERAALTTKIFGQLGASVAGSGGGVGFDKSSTKAVSDSFIKQDTMASVASNANSEAFKKGFTASLSDKTSDSGATVTSFSKDNSAAFLKGNSEEEKKIVSSAITNSLTQNVGRDHLSRMGSEDPNIRALEDKITGTTPGTPEMARANMEYENVVKARFNEVYANELNKFNENNPSKATGIMDNGVSRVDTGFNIAGEQVRGDTNVPTHSPSGQTLTEADINKQGDKLSTFEKNAREKQTTVSGIAGEVIDQQRNNTKLIP